MKSLRSFYNASRLKTLDAECQKFLQDKTRFPDMRLRLTNSSKLNLARFDKLSADLIEASISRDVDKYRKLMAEKYGAPDMAGLEEIVAYLAQRSATTKTQNLFDKFCELVDIDLKLNTHYKPSDECFDYYRKMFNRIFKNQLRTIRSNVEVGMSYGEAVRNVMEGLGLINLGWQIKKAKRGNALYIVGSQKTVFVPDGKFITNRSRAVRLLAHELLVHVGRRQNGIPYSLDEEGIGVLAEQLSFTRFMYKRSLRYLAVALGWGVDGNKRDFKQVYELVRLATLIIGFHDKGGASRVAFCETARAFNGGHSDIPGFVLTKDAVYFGANLRLWESLESHMMNVEEFESLIVGTA
ncbi:DUF1704 domain-containing protein [Candidatus Saccharibacteria bacterium]|nr:DUF1704 domain-containing protein [Candidatus Saccharibacteria bacterium]MCB9820997.1 DUF1704 domain-containing protein [Candidatus Nomurabacteria bacterium]